jgi:hypothetical protein
MKRMILAVELTRTIPSPKISDVKYVTVIGFRNVNPRSVQYVVKQLPDVNRLDFTVRVDLVP